MFDLIIALSVTVLAAALATLAVLRVWFYRSAHRQDQAGSPALRLALDLSREALMVTRDGRISHINAVGLKLLGESAAVAIGQPVTAYIHPDYQVLCADNFDALLNEEAATPAKLVQVTGRVLDIQLAAWRASEQSADILVSLRDISDLMRANHNVAAQLKRLNSILDTALDAIIVSDQAGHIETFNNAASAMFGYEPREVVGKPLGLLFVDPVTMHGASSMTLTGKRRNGTHFPSEMSLSACQLDDRLLSTALIRDVTERRAIETTMAYAATHDSLTALPNRDLLLERLQAAMAESARRGKLLALWFFDLNGIKTVNDVMGHAAGDQLLIAVGQRMSELAVGAEGMVSRFGGDEFAVIANGFDSEAEVALAIDAFLGELSRPFLLLGREVTVTANAGVALYPKHSQTASELLLDASAAMMFSKVAGRNQFRFFDPIMHRQSEEMLSLESELRRAIERDELMLYYQPQVDMRTGRIVGMESLVRWKHPTRGMVLPAQFIPVAEQTGLIVPLGEWVLRRACADVRRMERMGINGVQVGINVSPRQFERDIVGQIQKALHDTGVTPSLIDVEITESTLIDDPNGVIAQLQQMKILGVHISLDDFGTGFSSLSYLKHFPADTLKVDRSFVIELGESRKDEAIAMAIVNLAHSMGMTVLAEGVEEVSQYDVLRRFDCDVVQGYLFSPPLSFDDVMVHLERGTLLLPSEPKRKLNPAH